MLARKWVVNLLECKVYVLLNPVHDHATVIDNVFAAFVVVVAAVVGDLMKINNFQYTMGNMVLDVMV
jgi:hypothetical protein